MDKGAIVAQGTAEELKSELHGDAVVVRLGAEVIPEQVLAIAASLGDLLHHPTIADGLLRAHVDAGASALPAVLRALDTGQLRVATASVVRPSLDDVYMSHTGRTFTSTEEISR